MQPGTRQMEARFGYHYGYEYLATLLSSAGNTNSNLALGSGFFTGDHSLAHDIVAFDHAHGEEIARGGGYGNWGSHTPPEVTGVRCESLQQQPVAAPDVQDVLAGPFGGDALQPRMVGGVVVPVVAHVPILQARWTAIGFVDGSEKLGLWFRLPSWFSPSPDGLRSGCGTRARNEAWSDCNRVQSMMSPL